MQEIAFVLIGVFVGWLLSYIAQIHLSMLKTDEESLNDHIEDVMRLEEFAVSYWLNEASESPIEEQKLSTCVSGALTASSSFDEVAPRILGSQYDVFVDLDQQLFEETTGGDFSSPNKNIEPARVVNIMNLSNQLRALLRRARRALYWAR